MGILRDWKLRKSRKALATALKVATIQAKKHQGTSLTRKNLLLTMENLLELSTFADDDGKELTMDSFQVYTDQELIAIIEETIEELEKKYGKVDER